MKIVYQALIASSLVALTACGSHNHAPVVYGSDAVHQARIYNSPNEITRKQQIARVRQEPAPIERPLVRAVVTPDIEPVQLAPVSAIYLSEPAKLEPAAEPPQRAKGYIEVQRGDTVYAIGRRYSVTPQSIIKANRLRKPYTLSIGQALRLPKGATLAAAPASTQKVVARDTIYSVRRGDTLYSIARTSQVSVKAIAQANRLREPYTIALGQQLLIPQTPVSELYAKAIPASTPAPRAYEAPPAKNVAELTRNVSYTSPTPPSSKSLFAWPVRGAIIAGYGAGDLGRRNDGVNIAAPAGTPVRAAADGEVVYRGSELDGFGNLLLVKHTDGFVTAYAHTDAMLVKKGQHVSQGQVIAKVGQSGAVASPQLHFEIRQNLKSVDPAALLGSQ